MRKVVIYIATSLDGYIARANGDIDWLSVVERPGVDYGYEGFIETVDTIIVGRKTYDKVLSMGIKYPPNDKQCYIITRQVKAQEGNIIFYNENIAELINRLKSQNGKNIFCDGGAEIVNILMKNDLIDEYIISTIPVLLGNGIRLFDDFRKKSELKLLSSRSFASGLVQNHYRRIHSH